jgi:hypothetical protein
MCVFGLLYFTEPLFHQAWILQDRILVPVGLIRGHCGTLLASLRARWLGYCLSVALCAAGVLSLLDKVRAAGNWLGGIGGFESIALAWPLLANLYGPWSPFLILNLRATGQNSGRQLTAAYVQLGPRGGPQRWN